METYLKFKRSEKTKCWIGFVTEQNGRLLGVHETDNRRKKVCIISNKSKLSRGILPDVLYKVKLEEVSKVCYKVVNADVVQFHAGIEMCYIPKSVYKVIAHWGNTKIVFNAMYGKYMITALSKKLAGRIDVKNVNDVVSDFVESCQLIYNRCCSDGLAKERIITFT